MSISDKLTAVAENMQKVYNAGYDAGALPLTRIAVLNNLFNGATFPENYDLVLHLKRAVSMQYCFFNSNVRSVTLIAEQAGNVMIGFGFRNGSNLQIVDIKDYKATITDIAYAFYMSQKLKSIYGALNISGCSNANAAFSYCASLEDIEFAPNTTKVSISFDTSPLLTDKSIQSIIDGLADLTGSTAKTLTLHSSVGANLTDAQKAVISAKNWTLVY